MSADLVSRVYKPNAAKCCEACVFGSDKHTPWCPKREGYQFSTLSLDDLQRMLHDALYTAPQADGDLLQALSEEIHRRSPKP